MCCALIGYLTVEIHIFDSRLERLRRWRKMWSWSSCYQFYLDSVLGRPSTAFPVQILGMSNVSIIIDYEFLTNYRYGILVIDYNQFFWTSVLVLQIFQENLVIFAGKSNDYYKKI